MCVLTPECILVNNIIRDDYSIVPQLINSIQTTSDNEYFSDCGFYYPKDNLISCGSNVKLFDLKKN